MTAFNHMSFNTIVTKPAKLKVIVSLNNVHHLHLMGKRLWLVVLVWLVVLPSYAETKALAPAAVLPQISAPAVPVSPAKNPTHTIDQREMRAQLTARRFTTVAAELGAKISKILVSEGGRFKIGQPLIKFDCTLQQSQLNKSQAALAAANATWDANKRLLELNSIGKVELDVSEAEVGKNKAEVASMATMLGKCSVYAPFSGIVTEQKAREQQYVQPGQALLEIIDDSALELEFIAPSRWLRWLKAGYRFDITIDETGKTYPAKVLRFGGKVDPVSQSIKVVAVIDGKFPDLLTGMSGQAKIVAPPL
jgi:RND family efflux transporter MFP subunit